MKTWILGLILGLAPFASAEELQRREYASSKLSDISNRIQQVNASFQARIAPIEQRQRELQAALNRTYAPASNPIYAERANNSNQLVRLHTEKRNQLSNLERERYQVESQMRWKYRGNTASVNGQTIPEWASMYRMIDGRVEISPRIDPKSVNQFVARHQGEMERQYQAIAGGELQEIARLKAQWQEEWLPSLRQSMEDWYEREQTKIEQETEPIVAARSRQFLEQKRDWIDNKLREQEQTIARELSYRQVFIDQKVRQFFEQGLRDGYTPGESATDVRRAIEGQHARSSAVFDSVHAAWSGGKGQAGGVLGQWDQWVKQDVVGQFISEQRALFQPYGEKRAWLQSQLEAIEQKWVEQAEALNKAYLEEVQEWETKNRPEPDAPDFEAFEADLERLLSFHRSSVERVEERKRESASDLERLVQELTDTHERNETIDSVWSKIESDWRRGEMFINEEWRVFVASLRRAIEVSRARR